MPGSKHEPFSTSGRAGESRSGGPIVRGENAIFRSVPHVGVVDRRWSRDQTRWSEGGTESLAAPLRVPKRVSELLQIAWLREGSA